VILQPVGSLDQPLEEQLDVVGHIAGDAEFHTILIRLQRRLMIC
jgi:hypothetical protein